MRQGSLPTLNIHSMRLQPYKFKLEGAMLTAANVLVSQCLAKALWGRCDCPPQQQAQLGQE